MLAKRVPSDLGRELGDTSKEGLLSYGVRASAMHTRLSFLGEGQRPHTIGQKDADERAPN